MDAENKHVVMAATDLTSVGQYAIDHAAEYAKLLNGRLIVLHVVNNDTKAKLRKENKTLEALSGMMQDICDKVKSEYGVEVSYELPEGTIFTTIGESALKFHVDYLFMGTHGKKGSQFLVGGFAIKVVTSSPAPMFVVQKPASGSQYKNIIYPLDSCPGSKQKINVALNLNKSLGTTFHFLVYCPEEDPNKNRTLAMWGQLEKILANCKVPYTKENFTKSSGFENAIVAHALKHNADAIMLNTDPEKFTWSPLQLPEEKIIYNKDGIIILCVNSKNMNRVVGGL